MTCVVVNPYASGMQVFLVLDQGHASYCKLRIAELSALIAHQHLRCRIVPGHARVIVLLGPV